MNHKSKLANTHITNTSISVASLQPSDSALNHTDGYWKLWFSRGHDDGKDERPETTRVTQAKGRCVPLPRPLSNEHECYCTSAEGQTARHIPTRRQYSENTIRFLWKRPGETSGDHRQKPNTAALTAVTLWDWVT